MIMSCESSTCVRFTILMKDSNSYFTSKAFHQRESFDMQYGRVGVQFQPDSLARKKTS
jgi:hypothetical protein